MVKYSSQSLDKVFSALSDPTRRAILSRLSESGATVSELADPFGISLPAVSKHLRVLENAELIQRTIDGRIHHCQLNAAPLRQAQDWIAHYQRFWDANLDKLAEFLEAPSKESTNESSKPTRKRKP